MFSSSIPHYIIWYDKCYPHVHIIVEIHLVGSLDEVSLRPSATSPSSPWFNDELLFWTRSHSSFLENLTLSSHQFVLHLFFSGILSQRYPDTNRIWTSVRYDGWGIFPRVITLVYVWPGKVMTCLAPPVGGPIIIVSFLARLTILPWGNCKTYSISYSWWILCVPKVWPLLEDHVDAISKHVCGTLIFNKYIEAQC